MRTRIALLITSLALAVAACGGDDDAGGGDAASTGSCPGDAVTITMKDVQFDPKSANATVGQTICWLNDDTVEHNAVANSGADFKSELFAKGKTFTATVDQPGTVKYECTIHPGMTGEIIVGR